MILALGLIWQGSAGSENGGLHMTSHDFTNTNLTEATLLLLSHLFGGYNILQLAIHQMKHCYDLRFTPNSWCFEHPITSPNSL